jgi:3-oxoacyl-[acyl-carrier protein] reductase
MDLGISGKRAAVAAASAGLGLGSARALVAEGVHVAICGRDPERLAAATADLRSHAPEGTTVVSFVADVAASDEAARFVADARDALGGLDILVPNAGGPPPGTATGTTLDAYREALDLNLLSTIALCQAAVPTMRAAGWGRIVAITSVGVRQPIPSLAASVTARTGVTGYLKVLAAELAADGITVNSALPGIHATDRITQLYGDMDALGGSIPVGFVGDADDFGAVVAFLASTHARFITGSAIPVDGGAIQALL